MSDNNEKNGENQKKGQNDFKKDEAKELTLEQKLKDTEDKLLRSLAEIENQRRRFEKR